jgi:hypothetical protein
MFTDVSSRFQLQSSATPTSPPVADAHAPEAPDQESDETTTLLALFPFLH